MWRDRPLILLRRALVAMVRRLSFLLAGLGLGLLLNLMGALR